MSMNGKTVFITGGSRGIGRAIAERCARDGANVVVVAKTVVSGPKTPGTIHDAVNCIELLGGKGLAVQVDVRDESALQRAVDKAVLIFGGLDVVIHNAGAIALLPTAQLPTKRYDLMQQINTRAAWMLAKAAEPALVPGGHFMTLSPPIDLDSRWFAAHSAYTVSKYAMTLTALGMAAEWGKRAAAYSLWPRTAIATAAVEMLGGEAMMRASRTPAIMADAAHALFCTPLAEVTGRAYLDEDVLRERGITDFSGYAVDPEVTPMLDLFVTERS